MRINLTEARVQVVPLEVFVIMIYPRLLHRVIFYFNFLYILGVVSKSESKMAKK